MGGFLELFRWLWSKLTLEEIRGKSLMTLAVEGASSVKALVLGESLMGLVVSGPSKMTVGVVGSSLMTLGVEGKSEIRDLNIP